MADPTLVVTALDIVNGHEDPTGPARTVRITRGASGLLASVDGGAAAAIGGGFSVVAGAGITVDATAPTAPIVSQDTGLSATAGSAVQTLTISGLLGDTDGGYEIEGYILTTAAAPDFTLQINGADATAGVSTGSFRTTTPSIAAIGHKALLYIASNVSTEVSNISFRLRIGSKQGIFQPFTCQAYSERASNGAAVFLGYDTEGYFKMAAQITSIALHSSTAGTIDTGSFIRLRRLGFLA